MVEAAERPPFSRQYRLESTILDFTIREVLRPYREAVTHHSPGSPERTLGLHAAPAEHTPKGFHKTAFSPRRHASFCETLSAPRVRCATLGYVV